MGRTNLLNALFSLSALAAVISAPPADSAPAPSPAAGRAVLSPVKVPGYPGVAVPKIAGAATPSVRRINAALSVVRAKAVADAKACRADTSAGGPFLYRVAAQPMLNEQGILSLRMSGEVSCGGAHGNTLNAAYTFDLGSGAAINVVAASGLSATALATLGTQGYRGSADCKTFLASGSAALASAFVTRRGIGVNYRIDVGAAESCAQDFGLAPWSAVAAKGGLRAPLDKLARQAR